MNEGSPGYYAVIPASVRYDDTIPANAKLLYGEISALLSEEGFCYASNSYFADLYKVSERTITGLVSKLQKAGHIVIELERDKTGLITSRKLFLASSVPGGQPVENIFHTPRKYFREGIENNFQYTNTSNTNIEKESIKERKTKKKTIDPLPVFVEWIQSTLGDSSSSDEKNHLYLHLVAYAEMRAESKSPLNTKRKVSGLLEDLLDQSNGNVPVMCEMLQTAKRRCWLSVHAPKAKPSPAPSERRVYKEI